MHQCSVFFGNGLGLRSAGPFRQVDRTHNARTSFTVAPSKKHTAYHNKLIYETESLWLKPVYVTLGPPSNVSFSTLWLSSLQFHWQTVRQDAATFIKYPYKEYICCMIMPDINMCNIDGRPILNICS
jgi:hypothetical protein